MAQELAKGHPAAVAQINLQSADLHRLRRANQISNDWPSIMGESSLISQHLKVTFI
jgi:hypothetical protein